MENDPNVMKTILEDLKKKHENLEDVNKIIIEELKMLRTTHE